MPLESRPNVLILMPDELRADAPGYAGHRVFRTPHIDRLAREGAVFTGAYCASPLCMPARASMISGLAPHNHHIQDNAGHLPADDETFAQLLQRAGYHTAAIGKLHFWPDDPGRSFVEHEPYVHARGFADVHEIPGPASLTKTDSYLSRRWREFGLLDAYQADFRRRQEASRAGGGAAWASPLPAEEYADSYVGARAVEWLERYESSAPFLLHVSFGGPHPPFDAPEPYASLYAPDALPDPVPPAAPDAWVPGRVRDRMLAGRTPLPATDAARVARERMANYGGKIALIDEWIGRILHTLDARGLAERTLVIFLSDHGEMGGDHGRYNKSVFYEGAARIPLVLRWPGTIPPGRRVDALVEQVDLFATVVAAAGAPPSPRSFARSLLSLAAGAAPAAGMTREAVFSELKREVMVRTARHKYAVDAKGCGYLLFDLERDPHEQRNLIGHPDAATIEHDLRERLLTWLVSTQVERVD
jgi:arylsulfatase